MFDQLSLLQPCQTFLAPWSGCRLAGRTPTKRPPETIRNQPIRKSGLNVVGAYGSGPVMFLFQRMQVIDMITERVDGRIPIVAHAGDSDTITAIKMAKYAEERRVSAIASLTPYYYLHGRAEIDAHFHRLIDAVNSPVHLYKNPKYTNYCVTSEQVRALAEHGLKGVKDSSTSIQLIYDLVSATAEFEDFDVLVGSQTI